MVPPSKRPKMEATITDGSDSECDGHELDSSIDSDNYNVDSGSDGEIDKMDSDLENSVNEDSSDHAIESDSEIPLLTDSASEKWTASFVEPLKISFRGNPGLKVNMERHEPVDYFKLIANDVFFSTILKHTNEHANRLSKHSLGGKISRWKTLTVDDFKKWIALMLHMGNIRLDRICDYWSSHHLFKMPVFSQYMSQDCFMLILRALHFDSGDEDGFGKVNCIIEFFNKRMETIYDPKKNLSINQSSITCKERLTAQLKLHTLSESNGIVLKLLCRSSDDAPDMTNVVHQLLERKTGIGHSVFLDKHYNSVPLVEQLLKLKTHVTGTLESNGDDHLVDLVTTKIETGESINRYTTNGICINKWLDFDVVLTISSEFGGQMYSFDDRKGNNIVKPKIVYEYNKNINEANARLVSCHPLESKALRWYKKIGIRIIEYMLVNAHRIHNLNREQKLDLCDFRLKVIEALLGPPLIQSSVDYSQHFPTVCRRENNRTIRRQCKLCSIKYKKRRDSKYICPQCPNQPGFCLAPCFQEFHKKY